MSKITVPRILVFAGTIPPPYIGGAERTMLENVEEIERNSVGIVAGLVGFKHDEAVAAEDNPFAKRTKYVKIRNLYPPSTRKQRRPAVRNIWQIIALINSMTIWQAYREVHRLKPDVIICHNLWGWGVAPWVAARLTRTPLVQVVHDYQFACFRGTRWKQPSGVCESICTSCIPRLAASRAMWPKTGVGVFVSRSLKDALLGFGIFDHDHSHVAFPSKPSHLTHSRAEAKYKFGYIGRLEAEKGIEDFLLATKELGMSALVAGLGEEEYVGRLEMGHVEYVGQMSTQQFMDSVEIVVIPSVWPEPFGRVPLEAAATGRFAVVAEVGGLPESFALGNGNGLIYSDLTPAGLTNAMRRAVAESASADDCQSVESKTSAETWMIMRLAIDQALSEHKL